MAEELVMPRLSDTMEQGTIARWLKRVGDKVSEGEPVAEIETDKATMELNAYTDGVLLKILVDDGETAVLGAPIAVVGEEGEEVSANGAGGDAAAEPAHEEQPAAAAPAEPAKAEPAKATTGPAQEAGGNGAATSLKASPIARRMAADAGVDLRPLAGRGSGPDGRVVKVDVERLLAGGGQAPAAAPAAVPAAVPAAAREPAVDAGAYPDAEVQQPSSVLRVVARRMAEAKATVPHFYLDGEIDMEAALALRQQLNQALAEQGEKLSVNDLLIRACARALVEHPQFHRSWVDGKLLRHPHANIGLAVALDDGLIVPVLRDADTKGLRELAREARELAGRARERKLKQHEIVGGTFTVSNLGMFGIPNFGAIINPPEPGILAVGAVEPRPAVVDGQVVARQRMLVRLSIDHRAASGADGARFLGTVKRYLEAPLLMLA